MNTNFLRRWSRPKVVLVISTLAESPAHTLRVVSGLKNTGATLVLVQLAPSDTFSASGREIPFLVRAVAAIFERNSGRDADQAFLWAEILSEVTVLGSTPLERIPPLVDSLAADLVVLTAPEIGRIRFRALNDVDTDLFSRLRVPILVYGMRMEMTPWNGREPRKILVPVAFGPGLDLQIRFACRFARRHHGCLTVLHVFQECEANADPWQRTPVSVESKLPISDLKQEGIMCPMEIVVGVGYPERKILSFNEQKPHDLILMGGSRTMNSLPGSSHSVTHAVIAQASCPVLILGSAIIGASSDLTESVSELSTA